MADAQKKFVIVEVDPEHPDVLRLGANLVELETGSPPEQRSGKRERKVVAVMATPSAAGWKVRYADDGKFETGVEDWTPIVFDTRKQATESLRIDRELSLEREPGA